MWHALITVGTISFHLSSIISHIAIARDTCVSRLSLLFDTTLSSSFGCLSSSIDLELHLVQPVILFVRLSFTFSILGVHVFFLTYLHIVRGFPESLDIDP